MLLSEQIGSLLVKRVPILGWLPGYTKQDAVSDLIAGVTVGLTLMPQAIAYAALAELEPQYGLYSGCAGILMYTVFGSTKQVTIGPTALLSLLTYNYTHEIRQMYHADIVVIFTFLVGCIELLWGVFQFGFLVNFVSTPVISGFTSAAALIIASAQLKNLFGLSYNAETFVDIWYNFFKHNSETKVYDVLLGMTCIVILTAMKKLSTINFNIKDAAKLKILKKVMWVISTGRNALVVVACAALSYYLKHHLHMTPFSLTGNIVSGMPSIKLPPTSTMIDGKETNIFGIISFLGSGLFVVPLIAVISNLALAKAFSNGGQVDATQEMIALGMCNIVGSFVQSMPVAGAFSRSAVNNSSGVRTTFGCVYTSVLVLLTLTFLTPYFFYIPKASLAAVIMAAVLLMIDVDIIIKSIWSVHKSDLLPGFITFVFSLLVGVEYGLITGIAFDVLRILFYTIRPTVNMEYVNCSTGSGQYWYVKIHHDIMLFPAIDHIRTVLLGKTISKEEKQESNPQIIVIDAMHMKKIDFSAVQGLNSLLMDLRNHNTQLILLVNNNPDLVFSISRLSPDMSVISSTEELESHIHKANELHNIKRNGLSKDVQLSNCNHHSNSMTKSSKEPVIIETEDTRC